MRDLALLRLDAKRAYEWGRLWAALRIAFLVVPMTAVCAWETGAVSPCLVLGTALLVVATTIRWRQYNGFRVVSTGLRTGILPLAAALALCRFAPSCPPGVALALCCSAGVASGVLIWGKLERSTPAPWHEWLGAATVAGLTATLGCLALGLGTGIGAAAGVALGTAVATGIPRRAPV